jgi:hypothetical protein
MYYTVEGRKIHVLSHILCKTARKLPMRGQTMFDHAPNQEFRWVIEHEVVVLMIND